jgi:hypothetical protein
LDRRGSSADLDREIKLPRAVGVGRFGDGRPCGPGDTRWTGDSHKYGVYKHRRSLLIIESHGGAEQGYLDRHSHAIELFDHLCATLPPERIWDICYLVAHTQNQAYLKGRVEMTNLSLEGRLKSMRRDGRCRVEILPGPSLTNSNVVSPQ